jgi:hypothetical protein
MRNQEGKGNMINQEGNIRKKAGWKQQKAGGRMSTVLFHYSGGTMITVLHGGKMMVTTRYEPKLAKFNLY